MGAMGRLLLIVLTFASSVGFDFAFAQGWVMTSAPITNWVSVAMSADGGKVVAACVKPYDGNYHYPGPIYRSLDSGTNWTETSAPLKWWTSVTSSADGSVLVASASDQYQVRGAIYVSTNSGSTWMERTPTDSYLQLKSVACSADGRTLVTVIGVVVGHAYGGQLFVSRNSGESWTLVDMPSKVLMSVACSADGTKMAAGYWFWRPYVQASLISTDSGLSWPKDNGAGSTVAWSADGSKLMACPGFNLAGPIWLSDDFGISYTKITNSGVTGSAITASANGGMLVAAAGGGQIFTSMDSGATWTQSDAPITNWVSVASSADGSKLVAAVEGGGVYTLQTTPRSKLNISPSDSGLLISWIVPSMPFVLQENADLKTADWMDVPAQPTLNLSNLHHEFSVPLSETNRFYRLKSL